MDDKVKAEYVKIRKEHRGIGSGTALHWARTTVKRQARTDFVVPSPGDKAVEMPCKIKGIKLYLSVKYDEYAEFDEGQWLNARSVGWSEKAAKPKDFDWSIPTEAKTVRADIIEITEKFYYRVARDRSESYSRICHRFEPNIRYRDHVKNLRETYGRHEADCLARKYVYEVIKKAMSQWSKYVVEMCAYLDGTEIASAAIGGVETGDTAKEYRDYIMEVSDDLVSEVLSEVKEKVKSLNKSTRRVLKEIKDANA